MEPNSLSNKTILLWSNLTKIIPLRPSEFIQLKSDCVHQTKDNRYWIKVQGIIDVKSNRTKKFPIHIEINKYILEITNSIRDDIN